MQGVGEVEVKVDLTIGHYLYITIAREMISWRDVYSVFNRIPGGINENVLC